MGAVSLFRWEISRALKIINGCNVAKFVVTEAL